MKGKLPKFEGRKKNNRYKFNTLFLIIYKSTSQKFQKELEDLNNAIIQLDLSHILQNMPPYSNRTHTFLSALKTFSRNRTYVSSQSKPQSV